MDELTRAKISRGVLRGKAETKIQLLKEFFGKIQGIDKHAAVSMPLIGPNQ